MRPRFQWDGYERSEFQLNIITLYKDVLQLIGCNNRHGLTIQQIIDHSSSKKLSKSFIEDGIHELLQQSFIHECRVPGPGNFMSEVVYYKVNWSVIKQINKAISRLP